MNRDERRTRARATPPARGTVQGVSVLLPTDPEGGGSWISLNASGHSLALLNRYEDTPHDVFGGYSSRGGLVAGLADLSGPDPVEAAINQLTLAKYRPFTLASVAPGHNPRLFEWDGHLLECVEAAEPGLVRASSGSDQVAAERSRGLLFAQARHFDGGLDGEGQMALHRSHLPEMGPLSICMHRDEAITVSISYITVSRSELSFVYIDGTPCMDPLIHNLYL
jgi:hypothetical protein